MYIVFYRLKNCFFQSCNYTPCFKDIFILIVESKDFKFKIIKGLQITSVQGYISHNHKKSCCRKLAEKFMEMAKKFWFFYDCINLNFFHQNYHDEISLILWLYYILTYFIPLVCFDTMLSRDIEKDQLHEMG